MDCAKNYKDNFIYKNSLITILYKQKKEKIPKNISLQSIRPVIKKNDCKNKNDFRLINNRQKLNSGRIINTENNKQIKKLKYKFSGKVIMKK